MFSLVILFHITYSPEHIDHGRKNTPHVHRLMGPLVICQAGVVYVILLLHFMKEEYGEKAKSGVTHTRPK